MTKLIIGVILGVLILIFIFQNTTVVDIQLLFWKISMSRALMVLIVFGVGIILGWIFCSVRHSHKKN